MKIQEKELAYTFIVFLFFVVSFICYILIYTSKKDLNRQLEAIQENISYNNHNIKSIKSVIPEKQEISYKILQADKIISSTNPNLSQEMAYSIALILVRTVEKYPNLDYMLILSLIIQESKFDPKIESWAGARGLMQLMPETSNWLCNKFGWAYYDGIEFDPEKNMIMGIYYLNYLADVNKGNVELALAYYNGGGENKVRYSYYLQQTKSPESLDENQMLQLTYLPEETRKYPKEILYRMSELEKLYIDDNHILIGDKK